MKKRVFIIEDHPDMQLLYKAALQKVQEVEIVAQTTTAEDALVQLPDLAPDLVIADLSLPGMNGLEFTKQISGNFQAMKILIVTAHDEDAMIDEAKAAGADDLISKGNISKLRNTVRRLLDLPD